LDVTFNEALPLMDVVRELFVREGDSFAALCVARGFLRESAAASEDAAANVTG
jgi:hypothetical protein